ncbi:DUF2513 domain-containing protein [Lactobacillus salivarius]|uniref:DUF2513 domain-containing protein n=1 Tax=Ligilactobacillus salivarius TaxID=1624 RepID=UPI0015C68AAA|nr:DUF2513 domain-containing protein [Ligilactobacillus salivarius]NYA73475.1 DUF2513 domain-containing protein [Ligilactobacillus salivarius]
MELDYDFVRQLLLHIEAKAPLQGLDGNDLYDFATNKNKEDLEYTIIKLKEGKLITANLRYASNKLQRIYNVNLTYQGHEYLNNIRDNKIWKNTKKISSKLSSVSLEILKSIAINEINKVIGL